MKTVPTAVLVYDGLASSLNSRIFDRCKHVYPRTTVRPLGPDTRPVENNARADPIQHSKLRNEFPKDLAPAAMVGPVPLTRAERKPSGCSQSLAVRTA
ncbi:hypothetical protein GCM10027021_00910 [Dyella kyungheensis]